MENLPAISHCLQEIAVCGIKVDKRNSEYHGEWFHLLLFLAWQGWNISIEGEERILPEFAGEFEKGRIMLGVRRKDIEENFITTEIVEIARLFSKVKEEKYPFDRRFIHAIESTPEGSLRVYSE